MRDTPPSQVPLEPERYELRAAAPYRFDLQRRDFFKFLGAGLVVVSGFPPRLSAQESGGGRSCRWDRRGGAIRRTNHIRLSRSTSCS